jgi:hypothetical protein
VIDLTNADGIVSYIKIGAQLNVTQRQQYSSKRPQSVLVCIHGFVYIIVIMGRAERRVSGISISEYHHRPHLSGSTLSLFVLCSMHIAVSAFHQTAPIPCEHAEHNLRYTSSHSATPAKLMPLVFLRSMNSLFVMPRASCPFIVSIA